MEKLLWKLRTSKVLNKVLEMFRYVGFDKFFLRIINKWFYEHPTKAMYESREYFEKEKDRLENIVSILEDEKSKEIFSSLIEFRQTMNYKIHPGMELPQYFPSGVFNLTKDEVFIDCGGYIGDTTLEFIKQTNNCYKKIIMFELDVLLKDKISNNIKGCHNVEWVQAGVYSETTVLSFDATGGSISRIVDGISEEDGNLIKISVKAIDDCEECREATFIKMDLEGSEMDALHGAENTIKNNKPKLAICIYHSDADMIQIIEYIHALVPEYKIYVRHHSTCYAETVMYAVV